MGRSLLECLSDERPYHGAAGYSAFLQPDLILIPSSVALSVVPPCWVKAQACCG